MFSGVGETKSGGLHLFHIVLAFHTMTHEARGLLLLLPLLLEDTVTKVHICGFAVLFSSGHQNFEVGKTFFGMGMASTKLWGMHVARACAAAELQKEGESPAAALVRAGKYAAARNATKGSRMERIQCVSPSFEGLGAVHAHASLYSP